MEDGGCEIAMKGGGSEFAMEGGGSLPWRVVAEGFRAKDMTAL